MINFDNTTPTPLDPKVWEKMRVLLNADEKDQIILSPSPTISTNAVFHGAWNDIAKEYGKNHFLSTQIEDAAKAILSRHNRRDGGHLHHFKSQ